MNLGVQALYRLWIVEDSPEDQEILRYLLSRADRQYTIGEFHSAAALLRALGDSSEEGPDCILLDYHLPDNSALDLLTKLGGPDALTCPIVVVTGYENSDAGRAVLRLGAQDFIGKSWITTGSLTRCIDNAIERFALRAEIAEQKERFYALFHSSGDALGLLSEGNLIDCNAAMLRLFGCSSRDELIGKDLARFSPPRQTDGRDSSELAREHIAEAFRTGANRFEWHHCRLDGTPFLADVMLTGIRVGGRPVLQACLRDITAQKAAEAEIRHLNVELESRVEERTRELAATNEGFRSTLVALDRVDIGVHWSDYATGRTLHASPAAAKIIGYNQEELLKLSITDIVVGFPFAETAPAIRAAGMMRLEVNARHKDGHDVQVLTIVRFQEASDGFPDRFIAFIQDVSEQHRLRAQMLDYQLNLERLVVERTTELERTTARLAITLNALDKVGFGVAWIDCDSAKLLQTNESCAALLAYDRDEVTGLSLYDLEPDLTPEAYATNREIVRTRGHGNFERKVRTKKGEMRTVSLYLFYLVPGSNETGVFISFIEDITERRRLEEQLHRSEERFRLAMNVTEEGIWDWDIQSGEVYFSPGYTAMLGYAAGDFAPHFNTWASLLHPDEVEFVINEARRRLTEAGSFALEFRMRCKDGAYIWVLSRGETIERDPEGHPSRALGTHMDITQRREAKARLDELVRQQQVILDNASIGIMYLKDRKVVWCNHVMEKLLGYGRGELFGLPSTAFYVLASEADYVQAAEQARVVLAQGKQWSGEYLGKRKDGSQFWCRVTGQAIDPADPFAGVIACLDDITERKQWEAEIAAARDMLEQQVRERTRELAEINENYRITQNGMDQVGIGVTWVDIPTARFLYATETAARMLGYRPEEMCRLTVPDIAPDWPLDAFAGMCDRIRQEGNLRIEAEQLTKDGRRVPTEVALYYRQSPETGAEHFVAFVVDISERRRQEASLQASEQRFRYAMEATQEGVWDWLPLEHLFYASPGFRRLLDIPDTVSESEWLETWDDQVHPADLETASIDAFRTLNGEVDLWNREFRLRAGDDGDRWMRVCGRVVEREDTGEPSRVVGTLEDITERKQAETRLLRAKEAAEEANQAKNLFLAHMSHEIRTPMNAVLGLAQLLEQERLEPRTAEMVKHIREAGDALLHIINDILNFSKIEAGQFTLERQPFAPADILRRLRNLMSVEAEAKHLQLSVTEPTYCPTPLMGDAMRLEQVLINLCGNAIKFTQTGAVEVTVRPLAVTATEARLRFEVRDSGIGMNSETLERLFQPFSQGDTSISRRFGGTGLGLVISQRLAKLMGGHIGVSSTPNEGSTFWLELPFARVPDIGPTPPVPANPTPAGNAGVSGPRLAGLRVLVVDDNRVNRLVAGRALQREGAIPTEAVNGQEALDRLRDQPGGYDVVLMDIQMPIMDGLTATRAIRAHPELATLPVVALSAGVLDEERASAMDAGVQDFLTKPFELERLVWVLRPMLRRPPVQ